MKNIATPDLEVEISPKIKPPLAPVVFIDICRHDTAGKSCAKEEETKQMRTTQQLHIESDQPPDKQPFDEATQKSGVAATKDKSAEEPSNQAQSKENKELHNGTPFISLETKINSQHNLPERSSE
ncbi:MAG TPA: hypothetical protein V6C81_11480 [Planktothrix sp.]|jgi:hypothetical protein